MTTLNIGVDVELLVVNFLADQAEVAAIASSRIYSELPRDKVFPLVRVHQFGSLPVPGQPRWLQTSSVQLEAYGGSKRTAKTLLETCIAAMDQRLPGTRDEGIVSGVGFSGLADIPDDTFEPAKPRWLCVAQISHHP